MVTVEQIVSYCEHELARLRLNGDAEQLRRLQLALGVLIKACESAPDATTALRLRVLAARAADSRELLTANDE